MYKTRNTPSGRGSLRKSARRDAGSGKSNRYPEGSFDRFNPRLGAQWVRMPLVMYTYEVYSREAGEVIETTDPYYEFISHYVPRVKAFLLCSQGPRKLDPCYPHAILDSYYAKKHEQEEETGVKANYDDQPVSASRTFAFPVVGVDRYLAVPVLNKDGTPRLRKDKTPITNWVAESVARVPSGTSYDTKYGHNMHWSMGVINRSELMLIDDELAISCANCGEGMLTQKFSCPTEGCEETVEYDDLLEKSDILEHMDPENGTRCSSCAEILQPELQCVCGAPSPGSIFDFELRLKTKKVGDNNSLFLVDYRLPQDNAEIDKLLASPLDIKALYKPSSLDEQKRRLGDMARGVDPKQGTYES